MLGSWQQEVLKRHLSDLLNHLPKIILKRALQRAVLNSSERLVATLAKMQRYISEANGTLLQPVQK